MKNHTIKQYSKSRLATIDVGVLAQKKHIVTGLLEVDVTELKSAVKKEKQSGKKISFLAALIKIIATTIAENKTVQAFNIHNQKQVIYEDVDLSIPIEKVVDGQKVPLVTTIKRAHSKSAEDIYQELCRYKQQTVSSAEEYVLGKQNNSTKIFLTFPNGCGSSSGIFS